MSETLRSCVGESGGLAGPAHPKTAHLHESMELCRPPALDSRSPPEQAARLDRSRHRGQGFPLDPSETIPLSHIRLRVAEIDSLQRFGSMSPAAPRVRQKDAKHPVQPVNALEGGPQ